VKVSANEFLYDRFREARQVEAIASHSSSITYGDLLHHAASMRGRLRRSGVTKGSVVVLEGDYGIDTVAAFFALVDLKCIVVPLRPGDAERRPDLVDLAQAEAHVAVCGRDLTVRAAEREARHELYDALRAAHDPGLVVFTSGSSGESKAVVHDMRALLEKFHERRQPWRMLLFLGIDHLGGINTLLHVLSTTGCAVIPSGRTADEICAAIERHRVEVLPTSPTFLGLLLLSGAHRRHDLSSLRRITYGTEPMPHPTLRRVHEQMPWVLLQQTYGLSEVGALRTKSLASDSLWMRVGGQGFETRVVDGELQIRARSAMLGYLNAPSPFTDDGWLKTGDRVDVLDEYVRVLGRDSDIINVGGEKVFPIEVEEVLELMPGVRSVVVTAEKHPLMGQIVRATVSLSNAEAPEDFRKRMRVFCRDVLETFKIPQKVVVVSEPQHTDRFKKQRPRPE
jgi:acyl-CoA synthetase (AMP-forming)/AMP-acid ligase II